MTSFPSASHVALQDHHIMFMQEKKKSKHSLRTPCRQIGIVKVRNVFVSRVSVGIVFSMVVVQLREEIVQHAALGRHANGGLFAVAIELSAEVAPAAAAFGKGREHLTS
jgi:L-amino acid N-acyltransferase YncA